MDEKVQKVLDYIEEHKEEYLELLLRFCRQPSIAATGEGIEKMAGMVVDELKESVRLGQDMDRDGFLKPQRVAETIRTLKMFKRLCDANGVERILKERVPGVTSVVPAM